MRTTRCAVVLIVGGLVLVPASAHASLISAFDVNQPTTVFPAVTSTVPLEVTVLVPPTPILPPTIPIEIISMSLVSIDPLLDTSVQATGRNVGPLAEIDFVSGIDPEPFTPVNSRFDILIAIDSVPGASVPELGGVTPEPFIPVDGPFSSFSLNFDTVFNNPGTLHHQFLFAIADTQPDIQFANVLVTTFDTSIGVGFDYVGTLAGVADLFTLTMGGDFEPAAEVPEPSTLVLWSLGSVAFVGLGRQRRNRAA